MISGLNHSCKGSRRSQNYVAVGTLEGDGDSGSLALVCYADTLQHMSLLRTELSSFEHPAKV